MDAKEVFFMFKGLSASQKKSLEYEIISENARLKIARIFRGTTRIEDNNSDIEIILKNRIINIARQVEGLSIYRLESDADGYYYPAEKAWHYGELEAIPRRQTTENLLETLCDLIDEELIPIDEINEILGEDNSKIQIVQRRDDLEVEIVSVDDISDENIESEHPNIRKLVDRMDMLFKSEDFAGVLHTSASIFETLAKDVIKRTTIDNQPLGSFFEAYRKTSKLPESVLDMIKEIYDKRNKEPLAGHGSTIEPTIDREEAIILVQMTKAFIRMERQLSEPEVVK